MSPAIYPAVSRLPLLLLAVCTAGPAVSQATAQAVPADQTLSLMTSAKSRYYNLRTAGVKSFHCNVELDWPAVFTSIAGHALPEDGAAMKYLRAAKLTMNDDLFGDAKAVWTLPTADAENQKGLEQMTGGVKQMVEGFLAAWTPGLTGTLLSASPTSVEKTPTGYLVTDSSNGSLSKETLDKDLVLTHLSTKTSTEEAEMDTTFTPTPQGLVMTKMEGDSKQPPTAPPTHVVMSTTFGPVGSVLLPQTLRVEVPNVAVFAMKFTGCEVVK
jgi:hypothetical protein